jgi:Fe-S oxidoreductase
MKPAEHELCVYCPRLCRHVCPVAVGSGREAATPTAVMSGPWLSAAGLISDDQGGRAAALCTGCGACTAHCKIQRPVVALLAEARAALLPVPRLPPPPAVEGDGAWIAVEPDDRAWSAALAALRGEAVARLRDPDDLGAPLADHPEAFAQYGAQVRARVGGRTLVVATRAAARAATAHGIAHLTLDSLVQPPVDRLALAGCGAPLVEGGLLRCCGAGEPLRRHHPAVADEVGAAVASELGPKAAYASDARCAGHLRRAGADLLDPIDLLLSRA